MKFLKIDPSKFDQRHGGPFDRGSADSYYRRAAKPHYYKGDTYMSDLVEEENMNSDEIAAYYAGYDYNDSLDNFKF